MTPSRSARDPSAVAVLPVPVRHEVVRTDLLNLLGSRWQVPVLVLRAGAGFGKSTLLAQARRLDSRSPEGPHGWVSIVPGHESAEQLAAAVLTSLGVPARAGVPLDRVLAAVQATSPTPVCLVLDDLHRLPEHSAGARLLGDLVRLLPAHAHLVLASRMAPPVPLTRLRAADRLVEITEHQLAFNADEAGDVAAMYGALPSVRDLGGWPAAVRLTHTSGYDTAVRYAAEEVLDPLSPAQRAGLLALATVGSADEALITSICGTPVDLDDLVDRVPLTGRRVDGGTTAHPIWVDAAGRVTDAGTRERIRRQALLALRRRGELAEAGRLAVRHQDWRGLDRVAADLVTRTAMDFSPIAGSGWLSTSMRPRLRSAGLLMLDAATRFHADFADPSVGGLLERAATRFARQHDADAQAVALSLAVLAATARGDLDTLERLAAPIGGSAALSAVRACARATLRELDGDADGALATLDALPPVPPGAARQLAARLRVRCLLLAGRPAEASEVACEAPADLADPHLSQIPQLTRWLAGDPSGFGTEARLDGYQRRLGDACSYSALVGTYAHAAISASWGRVSVLARTLVDDHQPRVENPREAAFLTNAAAAMAVAEHDDARARAALTAFLALLPPTVRAGERHLRRYLVLGYVLDPHLRRHWDLVGLSPAERSVRSIARALLSSRDDRLPPDPLPDPERIFTALPLAWSVELACRLERLGEPYGGRLLAWLAATVGPAVRTELQLLTGHDDVLDGAIRSLAARVPVRPDGTLRIGVLGPTRVWHDEVAATGPELRRARVRTLLSLLVTVPRITRRELAELLWPELDGEAAGKNLRVTLAYLRRLLEPGRDSAEACFHLRTDAEHIWLHRSPALVTDLWDLDRTLTEARRAIRRGNLELAGRLTDAAIAGWRGAALPDLQTLPSAASQIARVTTAYLAAVLETAELEVAQGLGEPAVARAERVLDVDPYNERAHRIVLAAHLDRGDLDTARAAARRAISALSELGVGPEAGTAILLRRARRRAPQPLSA